MASDETYDGLAPGELARYLISALAHGSEEDITQAINETEAYPFKTEVVFQLSSIVLAMAEVTAREKMDGSTAATIWQEFAVQMASSRDGDWIQPSQRDQ